MIEFVGIIQHHIQSGWHVPSALTRSSILFIVTDGEVRYTFQSGTFTFSKGAVVFIPEGIPREARTVEPELHRMYSAHFHVKPPLTSFPLFASRKPVVFRPINFDYILRRFVLLNQSWQRKQPFYEMQCTGIVLEIAALLNRELSLKDSSLRKLDWVRQMQEYIVDHYREPLKIADIAGHIQKSPSYAQAIFKEVTDQTPIEYLHHIRMETALDMLLNRQMTVGETSDYLGYCNPSYFNRVFKKITGESPISMIKSKREK